MKEIIFKVNGMMCEGCENRVKNAIQNVEGVQSTNANHITGEVTVVANDNISKELIKNILEDIGYEIVGE